MPTANNKIATGGKILVECLRQRQSSMRAAIDESAEEAMSSQNEAMKSSGTHLQYEVARSAIADLARLAKADTWRGCGQALRAAHPSASGWRSGWAAINGGRVSVSSETLCRFGYRSRPIPKRFAL